jgi:hypothetical protein
MSKAGNYTYSVAWSAEDREYVGLCAEFPHLSFLDPDPAVIYVRVSTESRLPERRSRRRNPTAALGVKRPVTPFEARIYGV